MLPKQSVKACTSVHWLQMLACGAFLTTLFWVFLPASPTTNESPLLAAAWGGAPPPPPPPPCCAQSAEQCIQTQTTCPDPAGKYTNCSQIPNTTTCQQCTMSVVNWRSCFSVPGKTTFTCCVQGLGTDPWCGIYKQGSFNPVSQTCDLCNKTTTKQCGYQIAQCILGQNCPIANPGP
jgi:hypothetical protein